MEVESAKLLAAGIAVLGVTGAALGVGRIFSSMIDSIARNPSAKKDMQTFAYVGAALSEALGIFALLISFMIFFK
jgi:F0F1-type ATP synthase membrane subunit c/vacuolar-type H+-ATPase subunit K